MSFRAQKKSAQDVSLSDCIETGTDGASLALMDVVSEDWDLMERVSTRESVRQLRRALSSCLTEQERQVVVLRYGLNGAPPQRQREVAKVTGIRNQLCPGGHVWRTLDRHVIFTQIDPINCPFVRSAGFPACRDAVAIKYQIQLFSATKAFCRVSQP